MRLWNVSILLRDYKALYKGDRPVYGGNTHLWNVGMLLLKHQTIYQYEQVDIGITHLWNVGIHLRDYMAL
jgi:hypothetical protein